MSDSVAVAGFDSEGEALRGVAALHRAGIGADLQRVTEGRWEVRVGPDQVPGALEALSAIAGRGEGWGSLPSLAAPRAANTERLGLVWVGLGVAAVLAFAFGGSMLEGVGGLIGAAAALTTVVAILVRRAGRR